jgi:hypothetical protein
MVLPACVFVTTAVVLTILATIFTAILTPVFSAVLASRRLVRLVVDPRIGAVRNGGRTR